MSQFLKTLELHLLLVVGRLVASVLCLQLEEHLVEVVHNLLHFLASRLVELCSLRQHLFSLLGFL